MTRSLGLSLQPDGFSFVLLDGGAKRYNVKAHGSGGLDPEVEDPVKSLGKSLARALKQAGVGRSDAVVVAVPTLDTVLRELNLPFTEREKVRQVLKFEVESDLYHRSIDEVVCDFLELHDERATPSILVAAQPKKDLATTLEITATAGLEPAVLELDLGALVCALHRRFEAASEAASEAPAEAVELEAYLYLGPFTSLLLVAGPLGVRALRAIKIGWRELARGLPGPAAARSEAAESGVAAGASAEAKAEAKEESAPESSGPIFGVDPQLPLNLSYDEVVSRATPEALAAVQRRLAAEVRRGLAALSSITVARLNLLGAALPGLDEVLQTRLGVPTAPLSLREESGDQDLDPLALGAAVRGLGVGLSRMNFRQEEYRFTRGLERVEGPLTFALFGLLAYLLVSSVIHFKEIQVLKEDTAKMRDAGVGYVDRFNQSLSDANKKDFFIQTAFTNVSDLQRLPSLRSRVDNARRKLEKMVGEEGVEMPQSALEAWRLLMNVLAQEMESYPERWMVESLDFTSFDKTARQPAHVEAKFQITLFGTGTSVDTRFDSLQRALSQQPWALDVSAEGGLPPVPDVPDARSGTIKVLIEVVKEAQP
ncbi:MAG: hypothetical protein EYC70_00920 [Planctomycetota bacterium]|nr:MAG: hypothetical protein EYC70_00920 [Planctomycetota bacterium]